jgi:hypothetical protein
MSLKAGRAGDEMRLILAALLAVAFVAPAHGGKHEPKGAARPRQPNAADAPRDSSTPPAATSKQDRALDRALNGICRGC